jgi:hypothetical protein
MAGLLWTSEISVNTAKMHVLHSKGIPMVYIKCPALDMSNYALKINRVFIKLK